MIRTLLSLPAVTVALVLTAAPAPAQTYTWNTAAPSSAWLSAGNWTGGTPGTFPGLSGNAGLPNGTAADVAVFGTINGTLPLSTVSVDFAAASGSLSLGAVHLTAEDSNVVVAPAATQAGLLRLNGATLNAIPNVLLANTSATRDLTVSNNPGGTSSNFLGLRLGITNGVFLVNSGRSISVSAIISEDTGVPSGLTVRGGGTVTLSGANTYTGTTTVFDGTLRLNGTNRLNPDTQVVIGGGGGISNRLVLVGDQTITRLTKQGGGNSDRVVGGAATFAPALTLNIPTGQTNSFGGFLGGTGAIENGFRLVKDGGGTFVTTTPSTYTGGTTVRRGTLNMQGWLDGLGTGTVTVTPTGGDATFLVNASNSTQAFANAVTVNAGAGGGATVGSDNTVLTANNPTTLSGAFTLNGPVTLHAGNAIATRFTGGFNGSGNIAVVSPGNLARTAEFIRDTGVNTFGSSLSVGQNVTLRLGSGFNVLGNRYVPDATTISFAAGGKLELRPEGTDNEAVNALVSLTPGAGVIETVGGNNSTFFLLTVGAGNGSGTFGGVIQEAANRSEIRLVKTGTGTQTLAGANTYTGSTTINAGTLLATNPTGSATGTGQVTVNGGGTLGGSGRVGGPVTVTAGGTIRGGTANGIGLDDLTVVNRVTLDSGSTLAADLAGISLGSGSGGAYIRDRLVIDGTGGAAGTHVLDFVTTGGPVTIRLLDDAGLAAGETYTFILAVAINGGEYRKNGGTPVFAHGTDFVVVSDNWTFAGTPTLLVQGVDLRLTVTPVPEPAGLLGCVAAAAAGWAAVRRRGRRSV